MDRAVRLVTAAAAVLSLMHMPCRADSEDVARDAIRSALESWQTAFNNRDETRICDLFAPDLIANYQGQPERDFASLCDLLRSSLHDRERTYRYSLEVNEILVFGATAIVRLVWTLETEERGAAPKISEEPAIDIFRRQNDGSWKIARYMAYPAAP